MARPTKKNPTWAQIKPKRDNPETLRKLDEAFALDATVGEACYYANISQAVYYEWLKERPELVERFARLREKPVLLARQTVVNAFKSNPDIAFRYLERKKKAEFSPKQENDINISWWLTIKWEWQ